MKNFIALVIVSITTAAFNPIFGQGQPIVPKLGWYTHVQPVRTGFGTGFDTLRIQITSNNPLPAVINYFRVTANMRVGTTPPCGLVRLTSYNLPSFPLGIRIDTTTNCFSEISPCNGTRIQGCLVNSQSMQVKLFYCDTSPSCRDSIDFNILAVGVKEVLTNEQSPSAFSLSQNYPNPFNPKTTIQFSVPQEGEVMLVVYDIVGRKIAMLVNEYLTAGHKSVSWDGKDAKGVDAPSGVYFYRLQVGSFTEAKKLILLR